MVPKFFDRHDVPLEWGTYKAASEPVNVRLIENVEPRLIRPSGRGLLLDFAKHPVGQTGLDRHSRQALRPNERDLRRVGGEVASVKDVKHATETLLAQQVDVSV